MIWVVFAIMTGVAVLSVLWPLSRPARGSSRRDADVAFYQAQVAEIDRDVARGLASPADAEGARAQAGRRLLTTAQAGAAAAVASPLGRRIGALTALIVIPCLALGLYLYVGNPDFPDEPLSARLQAPPNKMDIGIAVARIEQHLAENPDDGRGWEIIAPVYLRLDRPTDAVRAFGNAIRLLGDSADRERELGEALTAAGDGQIDDRARAAFEAALRLDPKASAPRFYLGLAAEQVGDKARAADIWNKLLADAPPDAPWTPMVRAHMAALAGTAPAGTAPEGIAPEGTGPGPAAAPKAAAAIAAMAPAQQSTAIRGMVAGLAKRLAQGGGPPDDWLRLIRAYSVLQEPDKARGALADARHNLASDAAALARLTSLAHELGLES